MKKLIFIIMLSSIMYGCGFRLAGTSGNEGAQFSSSLQNTSVQSAASSRELMRLIERNLIANKINVVDLQEATAILNVLQEETDRVVLSLDNDGKAREFELILNVTFDVKKPDNTSLLSQQVISLNRDFLFEKTELLGSSEEEQQLFSEMRSDLARLIVYRLQNITEE